MVVGLATVRYVKALFALAKAKGERDTLGAEVARLGQLLASSPDLVHVLSNPEIAVEAKQRVMRAALLDQVSATLRDFVEYCLERRRSDVILEAAEEFARLDREDHGIVVASVDSAKPLDEGTRAALVAQLEETTGKSVVLKESVVPELIGGVAIQIGSRRWDGSVKRRLDDLEKFLQAGRTA
jgi:F-type H+-transporting ATPase subunit delta